MSYLEQYVKYAEQCLGGVKETQCKWILTWLDDFGSITPMEAMQELGIMRLAARVHEIGSRMGIRIDREMVTSINRYGHAVRYMKYKKAV